MCDATSMSERAPALAVRLLAAVRQGSASHRRQACATTAPTSTSPTHFAMLAELSRLQTLCLDDGQLHASGWRRPTWRCGRCWQ